MRGVAFSESLLVTGASLAYRSASSCQHGYSPWPLFRASVNRSRDAGAFLGSPDACELQHSQRHCMVARYGGGLEWCWLVRCSQAKLAILKALERPLPSDEYAAPDR